MASRVNVRFVAILVIVITVLVTAVAGFGLLALSRSGEQNYQLGLKLMAEGDAATNNEERQETYTKAMRLFAKAVHKDQTNVEWISAWIDVMERMTPMPQPKYTSIYFDQYLGAINGLAEAERTNVESHRKVLDELFRRVRAGRVDLQAWEFALSASRRHLEFFDESDEGRDALRRYTGLARIEILNLGIELPDEDRAETLADLEAAAAADPSDGEAIVALATYHLLMANRTRSMSLDGGGEEHVATARRVLEEAVAAHPESLRPRFALLQLNVSEAQNEAAAPMSDRDMDERFGPELDAILDAAISQEAGSLDQDMVFGLAMRLATDEATARKSRRMVEHALEGQPSSAQLLMALGRLQVLEGEIDAAIDTYGRVVQLPDLPLSLEGLLLFEQRHRAVQMQAEAALAQWERAETAEARDASIERARQFEQTLARAVGDDFVPLLYLRGRLAYADGNMPEARRLLNDYLVQVGDRDIGALNLLGEVLMAQESFGAARSRFERVLSFSPSEPRALYNLARLAFRDKQFASAEMYLGQLEARNPDSKEVRELRQLARDLTEGGGSDPALGIMLEAQQMATGLAPDLEGAIAKIREGMRTYPEDVRLKVTLAQLLAATGDKDGALEQARAALAIAPDNQLLRNLEQQLLVEDPVAEALRRIDESDAEPFWKHVSRYRTLVSAGRTEEADAALDGAAALKPEDPLIIELLFVRAVEAQDEAEARRLAELGQRLGSDGVGGLTFQARLEMLDNRLRDAEATLVRAVDQDPLNPAVHRVLAEVRLRLDDPAGAVQAYQRALEIRTDDLRSIKGLLRALVRSGANADALAAARRYRPEAERDVEFIEQWLTLESSVPGGDREQVRQIREQLARQRPDNERNKAALARLLMAQDEWDASLALIEDLKSRNMSLPYLDLHARWLAAQNRLTEAGQLYMDFAKLEQAAEQADAVYIYASRLYLDYGRPDVAMNILEQGRGTQDPQYLAVDRELADVQFSQGLTDEAAATYEGVLERTEEDPERFLFKRLMETYTRSGRYREVEERITALGSTADQDAQLLLLRAEAAAGLGDRQRAGQLYNLAITAEPTAGIGYLKRAEFNMADPALQSDVIADLQQAITLAPRLLPARQRLAEIYANSGRWDESIDELKEALRTDPQQEELRARLARLLVARGREAEGLDLIAKGLEINPHSIRLQQERAASYVRIGDWPNAREQFGRLWLRYPSPQTAAAYVAVLLEGTPEYQAALEVLSAPQAQTDEVVGLRMQRAHARKLAGQPEGAREDIIASLAMLDPTDAPLVDVFVKGVQLIEPSTNGQLAIFQAIEPEGGFTHWLGLHVATLLARHPDTQSLAIDSLRVLTERTSDTELLLATYRTLGGFLYLVGEYEEAASWFKRGLDINPSDHELLNNVAYTLAKKLDRPSEARVYADQATALRPRDPMLLDTLAAVLILQGEFDQAGTVIERTLEAATANSQQVMAYLRFAELALAQDDEPKARGYLRSIDDLVAVDPDAMGNLASEVEDLRTRLGAP